ncbi:hypothetical protein PILCRDRAFT_11521 [Piloderma croceum F 1598]|uniref:Uncharacterized protein n=1 Tax=Piloderma croceum (strain F 1598) TaxID=765440 RepID=A0A0C3FDU2_PILCF|nr:hypothetical protein PILCRDRAFT_11521 [Piloderma croceum F 1598]
MALWLERREKIYRHQDCISWLLAGKPPPVEWHPPDLFQRLRLQMTKHPLHYPVLLGGIVNNYDATYFYDAFATYSSQDDFGTELQSDYRSPRSAVVPDPQPVFRPRLQLSSVCGGKPDAPYAIVIQSRTSTPNSSSCSRRLFPTPARELEHRAWMYFRLATSTGCEDTFEDAYVIDMTAE